MAETLAYRLSPGWLRVKEACFYSGVKERTLRTWLHEGLRYSKVHGTVLINVKNLDEFIQRFEIQENKIDELVKGVMDGL